MSNSVSPRRRGFTLIELLAVIAVLGLLIALLLPAIQAAREVARRMTCKSHLRQLALGVLAHHEALGHCPVGRFGAKGEPRGGPNVPSWGWLADVLPYVEQKTLHDQGRVPEATHRESGVVATPIDLFLCPTDPYSHRGPNKNVPAFGKKVPLGSTNYHAITGANWGADATRPENAVMTDWPNPGTNGSADGFDNGDGLMFRSDFKHPARLKEVADGMSQTFMLGETLPQVNERAAWPYANANYATCAIPPNVTQAHGKHYPPGDHDNVDGLHSRHRGGVHVANVDGSARFIVDDVDLEVYRAMATIAGSEVDDRGELE